MLTLAEIAQRCSDETERFFQGKQHDPRHCFELFRRAFAEADAQAWELVYAQYQGLVTGWVNRHSALAETGEATPYFVNRAFEKMWTAVTPAKFRDFADLKSALRYLQMCVHSVLMDHLRASAQARLEIPLQTLAAEPGQPAPGPEAQVQTRIDREALWRLVQARLLDDQERLVIDGLFVLGLKPRELRAAHAGELPDVSDVYRIRQNVMARLRRDPELRDFLGDD